MPRKRPLSLSELQTELAQWRSHRQPRQIPPALREQAVRLLEQHKPCEIKTALNINHGTLKRWKQECGERAVDRYGAASTAFISVPVEEAQPAEPIAVSSSVLKITRHAGDGSSVCVEGSLSPEQWRCTLSLLVYGEIRA